MQNNANDTKNNNIGDNRRQNYRSHDQDIGGIIVTERKCKNEKRIIDSLSDTDEQTEQRGEEMILSIKDISQSIPMTSYSSPNPELQKTHTEHRWRFFDLKGRKLIEISRQSPGRDRIFVDNKGNWINFELKGNWDQFLIDTRYYYSTE